MRRLRRSNCERFLIITREGYGFPLPEGMKPGFWVEAPSPTVHAFTLSAEQSRTDDYQRPASAYRIEGTLEAATEAALMETAEMFGVIVRQGLYLQRAGWGVLQLLDGSEIDLKPKDQQSNVGTFGVTCVSKSRKWLRPDGSVILGER